MSDAFDSIAQHSPTVNRSCVALIENVTNNLESINLYVPFCELFSNLFDHENLQVQSTENWDMVLVILPKTVCQEQFYFFPQWQIDLNSNMLHHI